MKNRIIVVVILLVVVFLAGFIPQYMKATRLETELSAARQNNALGQLNDLAGLACIQVFQKNYGLAAASSTQFFSRTREVANQTADPNGRKALEDLLAMKDKITLALAKGDPEVSGDLQALFEQTRRATGSIGR